MSTSSRIPESINDKDCAIATITPHNRDARFNLASICERLRARPAQYQHHKRFIQQDGERPYFVLRLNQPHDAAAGWVIGRRRLTVDDNPSTATDLLLDKEVGLFPRQAIIDFDRHGRLCVQRRKAKVMVDGEPLTHKSPIRVLEFSNFLQIGELIFHFQYVESSGDRERRFQVHKNHYLTSRRGGRETPHYLSTRTPSAHDMRFGDWTLHGVVGQSGRTTIQAASNNKTSDLVAVKTLSRSDTESAAMAVTEIDVYESMRAIRGHEFQRYVMLMHSVIYRSQKQWNGASDEVFLLWQPLAKCTFFELGPTGTLRQLERGLKKTLFAQALCGLKAVHDYGWVHQDVKPDNLLIVRLDPPRAIVGDFGHAIQLGTRYTLPTTSGRFGTTGWIAPEMENAAFSKRYSYPVDVWSLGLVGAEIFSGNGLPWDSRRPNIFLDPDQSRLRCYEDFVRALGRANNFSVKNLLSMMLQPRPSDRITLKSALRHPAIQDLVDDIRQGR